MGANSTHMTYGDYAFSPVPFLVINKEYLTTDDGERVGVQHNITLEGTLTPLGTPQAAGGYVRVDELQDELKEAFSVDGNQLLVECSGDSGATEIMRCYPSIVSIDFDRSNDNWVFTCPFTIQMVAYEEPYDNDPDYAEFLGDTGNYSLNSIWIKSYEESWNVEFAEEYSKFKNTLDDGPDAMPWVLRMTRNLSAVGIRRFEEGDTPESGVIVNEAWEEAATYIRSRLILENAKNTGPRADDWKERFSEKWVTNFNMNSDQFERFNHVRNISIDETAGSYSVTETWIVINPDASGVNGNALEDFTVTTTTSAENPLSTVTVEGTILGLEERHHGIVTEIPPNTDDHFDVYAYDNAKLFWETVEGRLYNRAVFSATGISPAMNPNPLNTSVGHNPSKGTITYSYTFDNRPCNFIEGAITENITISEDNPTDVFASLVILGRAKGPILQQLGTVTAATRTAQVEITVAPPTGCDGCADVNAMLAAAPSSGVDAFMCCLETQVESVWDVVYKSADTESWNPKTGLYTRNVSWTMTQCDGDAPSTTFC